MPCKLPWLYMHHTLMQSSQRTADTVYGSVIFAAINAKVDHARLFPECASLHYTLSYFMSVPYGLPRL